MASEDAEYALPVNWSRRPECKHETQAMERVGFEDLLALASKLSAEQQEAIAKAAFAALGWPMDFFRLGEDRRIALAKQAAMAEELRVALDERTEIQRKLALVQTSDENVWRWLRESDDPASLACPVVFTETGAPEPSGTDADPDAYVSPPGRIVGHLVPREKLEAAEARVAELEDESPLTPEECDYLMRLARLGAKKYRKLIDDVHTLENELSVLRAREVDVAERQEACARRAGFVSGTSARVVSETPLVTDSLSKETP